MRPSPRAVLTLVLCLVPAPALAQSITTSPIAPVPVGNPFVILAIGALLIGAGYWTLRGRAGTHRLSRFAAVAFVGAIGAMVVSHAQATLTFSDPNGETLSIPINPEESADDVTGWEPADFTNNSGVPLLIEAIDQPTFSECFPGGLDGELLPGSSDPSPHPLCEVNDTLADGATCRVDVETICRAAAVGSVATLTSLAPTSGPGSGGTLVTLIGTNLTGATGVTFDGLAATSVTVVNATTVTAVTPAHGLGVADVAITTPAGSAALDDAFTYTMFLTDITADSGSASGGVGVTLTGDGLAGVNSVTFDGLPATSFNVVSATTITAVTPAHLAGVVDVEVSSPDGTATLTDGFTYLTTAIGQEAHGGVIAGLAGGLRNLIAAIADNSTGVVWGGDGTAVGAAAHSELDGAANTAAIVSALGNNAGIPYAAQICNDYEVDSQGNTPCQGGNTCYNDWFLPSAGADANNQMRVLQDNRVAIGGFAPAFYWTSTEFSGLPTLLAFVASFDDGAQGTASKALVARVRCVRIFTP